MTPDQLVEKLKKAIPQDLRSVVLYGSAAVGDHAGKRSDYNILVLTRHLDLEILKSLSGIASEWTRLGNPPPLLLTATRLEKSSDVFPIELLDIQESHKILFGDDFIRKIRISPENLRLQVEQELQGKLIQLRERFLLTGQNSQAVIELMIDSLSTFLVLFRAALRLFQNEVPRVKMEALQALTRHIQFDPSSFHTVNDLKTAKIKGKDVNAEDLFQRYLKNIGIVVNAVDAFIHESENSKGDV